MRLIMGVAIWLSFAVGDDASAQAQHGLAERSPVQSGRAVALRAIYVRVARDEGASGRAVATLDGVRHRMLSLRRKRRARDEPRSQRVGQYGAKNVFHGAFCP